MPGSASISFTSSALGVLSRLSTLNALPPVSPRLRRHARNIDLLLGQQRADPADHAGPVLVFDDEENPAGTRLQVVPVEPYDARMDAVDRRADFVAQVALVASTVIRSGKFAALRALRLRHLQAQVLRRARRVHFIHRDFRALEEEPLQNRNGVIRHPSPSR